LPFASTTLDIRFASVSFAAPSERGGGAERERGRENGRVGGGCTLLESVCVHDVIRMRLLYAVSCIRIPCVCIRTYIRMHTYVCSKVCVKCVVKCVVKDTSMYPDLYTYAHVCVHNVIRMQAMRAHTHTNTHKHTHTHTSTCVCACTYTRMRAWYVCVHIHACVHSARYPCLPTYTLTPKP